MTITNLLLLFEKSSRLNLFVTLKSDLSEIDIGD